MVEIRDAVQRCPDGPHKVVPYVANNSVQATAEAAACPQLLHPRRLLLEALGLDEVPGHQLLRVEGHAQIQELLDSWLSRAPLRLIEEGHREEESQQGRRSHREVRSLPRQLLGRQVRANEAT
eukprot:scaffold1421_cov255-Pinguiococcus_pyrenoidosus.AAC.6